MRICAKNVVIIVYFNVWFSMDSSHLHPTCTILCFHSCTQKYSAGVSGRRGSRCWPESWPATPLLPAAKAQRSPLGELRQEEKPGGEWVSSSSTEKKTLVYPPWPLCHPWILFTPREAFSLIDPPGPSSSPRALATFTVSHSCLQCSASSFSLSLSLFYSLNQERCSPSIANWLWRWTFITWWLGVCMVVMWESGSVLGEKCGLILGVIIMITHFISVTGDDHCTRVSWTSFWKKLWRTIRITDSLLIRISISKMLIKLM